MTPNEFIAKWRGGGKERAEAQSFFNDLCLLAGHKTPREADPSGTWFAFEYGAEKSIGGNGFADAWLKGKFGWEAKGTGRSLQDAYAQLKMYSDDLQNPPLLVVSDLQTIEIHTNFTNTVKEVHRFTIEDLVKPEILRKVRAMFHSPNELRPGVKRSDITEEAAKKFADLAHALRARKHPALAVAHFLNRLLFCMFAEDIGLLPENLFTRLIEGSQGSPEAFQANAKQLFAAMAKGGQAGFAKVEWFNGGLFDSDEVLDLTVDELKLLHAACKLHWDQIDPSIFGTLFERGLDPSKRSQLGAHYTDPSTIKKIIQAVIVDPLLAEWDQVKAEVVAAIAKDKAKTKVAKAVLTPYYSFLERLRKFNVLDPACGSGNFLYLSLQALKDIEARVHFEAEELGLPRQQPVIGPANVLGMEINEYAAELARITVWIGEIQWMIHNGYGARTNPILQPLNQIQCRDALLNKDGSEADWPAAEVIVGNPPFIGDKKMRGELGEAYTLQVRAAYAGRVPGAANFVVFWFEKANDAIRAGRAQRAGLVAPNTISGGANLEVLKHIVATAPIFKAWSNEKWWDKKTQVRVAMICFGRNGGTASLDDLPVSGIFADLSEDTGDGVDTTLAKPLPENDGVAFLGIQKTGAFDIPGEVARAWLALPNPNGRPNAEVVRPWFNGEDLGERPRDMWIVDYGTNATKAEASLFEAPFKHLVEEVQPLRVDKREAKTNENWWIFQWARPLMRRAIAGQTRYIATPETPTHNVFSWVDAKIVPDKNLIVFAREDDTTFGILSSTIHLYWVQKIGSRFGAHPTVRRYNSTRVFETFPFPEGLTLDVPAKKAASHAHAKAIADAAKALVAARDKWLNPTEWVDWVRTKEEEEAGLPARPVAKKGHEADLAARTIAALYNEKPTWLKTLQDDLDRAVAQAYGWKWPMERAEVLKRLLELNQSRLE
ncbi:class I SAM-dependent DNA methyltransferase [Luteimonas sp. SDU101]|uniref:class I SAM-dependent DNA methyltransferase n=1 Tax=Luteimonas sp. SDU101 TaxID=3422593 RepID=UPI003EBA389A